MEFENKIRLNLRSPFSAVKLEIAQDLNLSLEALGMITFLQSLPHGWHIHPSWIQKKRGIGRRKWLSIAKELIKCGVLFLYRGTETKGSHYEFKQWDTQLTDLEKDMFADPPTVLKSDSRKKRQSQKSTPYINTLVNLNTNNNNKNEVVVKMVEIGIDEREAYALHDKYGDSYILDKISLLDNKQRTSRPGWLISAIKRDFKESKIDKPKPIYVESTETLHSIQANHERANTPQCRAIGEETLKKLAKSMRLTT